MDNSYKYLIELRFLGFRYHGWAIQPQVKTLHGMLNKTLNYILEGRKFKSLGSGRTDALVSASYYACEIIVMEEIDIDEFFVQLNDNLPQDMSCLGVKRLSSDFNIIQSVAEKEYRYYFSFGKKNDPFAAPFIASFPMNLDIDRMKKAALLFEGEHNFRSFCYKPVRELEFVRTITSCCIEENTDYQASFFPEKSFVMKVRGKGFMRYQVRLMAGALLRIGTGEISETTLMEALDDKILLESWVAPASGLILHAVDFEE